MNLLIALLALYVRTAGAAWSALLCWLPETTYWRPWTAWAILFAIAAVVTTLAWRGRLLLSTLIAAASLPLAAYAIVFWLFL